MRHIRIFLSPLIIATVIMATPYLCARATAYGSVSQSVALGMQSSTLQRATATPTPDARAQQCTRRTADWERNRMAWSLFLGFIMFLAFLYLLTFWRFKNTVTRVIVSIAAAVILAPAIMAVIRQDTLKVCIDPPGFLASYWVGLSTWGTYAGIAGTGLVIYVLRWLVVSRRFREELPTT